jgi:cyclopropane fatty-acyl-phospholipid synthase-like methyltransferase
MLSDELRTRLYRTYGAWKDWDDAKDGGDTKDSHRFDGVFEIECRRGRLTAAACVLEIGFGEGRFLNWCSDAGHRTWGIEAIPELVERARAKGHEVILSDGNPPLLLVDRKFDLIAAFDVFEHFTIQQLYDWLVWMRSHLMPDGRIVARFPNGASPFGRVYQSGDLTHQLTLCATSIDQLARLAGLRVVAAHNAARGLGGRRARLTKRLAYMTRDLIEVFLSQVYYGRHVLLDPAVTVIIGPC